MSKKYHVLNLIRKIDLTNASPKKRAVIKLLKWKPEAYSIQFHLCHCRKRAVMLSYLQPEFEPKIRADPNGDQWQECGYLCGGCEFGNAGSRLKSLGKSTP